MIKKDLRNMNTAKTPILSLLVCTLQSRMQLFDNLKRVLSYQSPPEVEMLVCMDKGENTIGKKRNDLLHTAKGEYVCYLDDDDMISPYYVSSILSALESKPDCVGIKGVIVCNKIAPKTFIHSLEYAEWFEKNGIYYRCPNHLNPVKRDIALTVGFPSKNSGEDRDYSFGLRGKLKTEVMIEDPIYYYYPSIGK